MGNQNSNSMDDAFKMLSLLETDPHTVLKQKNDHGYTLLHLATVHGYLEVFKFILHQGVKKLKTIQLIECITLTDENERTILHCAAEKGFVEFLNIFIGSTECLLPNQQLYEFISTKDQFGLTALHLAVINNHVEIVSSLLEKLSDQEQQLEYISVQNQEKKTALHLAAANGNLDIVHLLSKAGLRSFFTPEFLNLKDDSDHTALQLAILNDQYQIAEFLLKEGENNDRNIKINFDMLKHTLQTYHLGVEDKEDYEYVALCLDDTERILTKEQQRLILTTTDSSKRTILHSAAMKNHEKTLKFIFKRSDEILSSEERKTLLMQQDTSGYTAFYFAVPNKNYEIVKLLIDRCALLSHTERKTFWMLTSNNSGHTALHWVLKHGNLECVSLLLDELEKIEVTGELLWIKNARSDTVFHSAVQRGDDNIMQLIWYSGILKLEPEKFNELILQQNNLKKTAFHLAVDQGNLKIVEWMFSNESSNFITNETRKKLIMGTDSYCKTVLHSSAQNKYEDMLKFLLSKITIFSEEEVNTLVKLKDEKGYSVLHSAVQGGSLPIVKILLEALIKTSVAKDIFMMKDIDNNTIFHLAASNSSYSVIQLLFEKAEKNKAEGIITSAELGTLVMTQNKDKYTALHLASKRNDSARVELMFEYVVNVEKQKDLLKATDSKQRTALHWSASKGNLPLVRVLLDKIQRLLLESDQQWFIKLKDCDKKSATDLTPSRENEINKIIMEALKGIRRN